MKKETFLLSAFIFGIMFLLLIPAFVSASVNISCSDNSKVSSDQNEISVGDYRIINELGIGVAKASESVFYKRISADLLLDTKRATLSNKSDSSSETISLLTDNYKIEFVKTNASSATIKVGGESVTITLLEAKEVKGIFAMLSEMSLEEEQTITVIIGAQQILLSNEKSAEKITFGNRTFVVELKSASENNALIKVSKCLSGEINSSIQNSESNATINATQEKQKTEEEKILEENLKSNASTTQVSIEEIKKRKQMENESKDIETKTGIESKQGFFSKVWNWIKMLFGFESNQISNNSSQQILNTSK